MTTRKPDADAAARIVARYRDDNDDYGYDTALDHLILLGYSEGQADDLLHPLRKAAPLDPLEKIVGRCPIVAAHRDDGIHYADPLTGQVVVWTMVHTATRTDRKEQRSYERQRFVALMDAEGYGVVWA